MTKEIKFDRPTDKGVHVMTGGLHHKTERSQLAKHLYIQRFFDVEDFWRCGDEDVVPEKVKADGHDDSRTGEYDFTHTNSWAEALDLGVNGWPDGVAEMDKVLRGVRTQSALIDGNRKSIVYGVSGSRVDVPRALSGEPQCMRRRKPVRTADGNHIKIAVNVSTICSTPEQAIRNRGAAICALVMKLEADGYTTELIAFESCERTGRYIGEVPVKRPEDYLNRERVAMMFAHPSTLRRGMFAVQERLPEGVFDICMGYGYGRPSDLTEQEAAIMKYSLVLKRLQGDGDETEFDAWTSATHQELAEWVSNRWAEAVKGATDND